jgi:hypothetical protein
MKDGSPVPTVMVTVEDSGSLVPGNMISSYYALWSKFWSARGEAKEGGPFARIVRVNDPEVDFEPSLAVTLTD